MAQPSRTGNGPLAPPSLPSRSPSSSIEPLRDHPSRAGRSDWRSTMTVDVHPPRPAAPGSAQPPTPSTTLRDRYGRTEGTVALTGVQALVRLPLDQHRADLRAGLRPGGYVSGYEGSPLA